MRLVVGGALLLSVCVLGGCTKYWYQDGKSFKQAKEDLAACQNQADQLSNDMGSSRGMDAYDGPVVRQCMEERGYRRVTERALPARALRETSPVFGVPGVAGTID
ncbi:MAG: hypothetical protein ABFE13_16630 [Phycisphaerales bacterium]